MSAPAPGEPAVLPPDDGKSPFADLFARLARSSFRRRFGLHGTELELLRSRGMPVVLAHARELIAARLAPAHPPHDGRQTPMRGHPVFLAQHATATCCRGCLRKWHGIAQGRELTPSESAYVVAVLGHWLALQEAEAPTPKLAPQLALDLESDLS